MMCDSSDLAQWSLQKNLHATDDLGLALGNTIEVLWDVVSEEGEASTSEEKSIVWWTGELIGEVANPEDVAETDAFGLSSKWRLRYQKYGSFAEEERTVVFLEPHLLLDLEDQQLLEWRKYGEPYEPKEQASEDQVITLEDVTAELNAEGGPDVFQEGMKEFGKMPYAQQQLFADNYRAMADLFKENLRKILEQKGEGYVVDAEDIHRMVEGMKSKT
jgi:hypothetical protein